MLKRGPRTAGVCLNAGFNTHMSDFITRVFAHLSPYPASTPEYTHEGAQEGGGRRGLPSMHQSLLLEHAQRGEQVPFFVKLAFPYLCFGASLAILGVAATGQLCGPF